MKVINLDKFKTSQQVELDGALYNVGGVTVEMHLNDSDLQELNRLNSLEVTADVKERIAVIVKILKKLTNIPEEKLLGLQLQVLSILLQISQGINPDENEAKEEATEGPNE